MGDHVIIKVEKKDDLKAKYGSALKALAVLGIKIKAKEPQAAKLAGEVSKAKPGEFILSADAKSIRLVFKHDKTMQVLGMLDPKIEEDIEALKAIQKATGVSYKDRIAALEAHKHAPSKADPRAVKQADADVALAIKARDDLKRHLDAMDKLTIDAVFANAPLLGQFERYAKAIGMADEVAFILAVRKNGSPDKIYAQYIMDDRGKAGPVNYYPADGVTDKATIVKDAHREIWSELKEQKLSGFRAAIRKPSADRLAQAEKDLKQLQDVRAKLDK